MKYATFATIGLGLVIASTTAQAQTPTPKAGPELKTMEQKIAYSIGVDFGRRLAASGVELDPAIVAAGLRDGVADKAALTDEQMGEVMQAFKQQMMAKQQGAGGGGAEAEKNLKAGQAFLAGNKTKPGVITLPDGLQYKVIREGTGKTPKLTDNVVAHYRGTLIDGTEFDSSYKRGQPTPFPVNGVIQGWTEILQKMKAGSKYQIFVPSELAYGPRGSAPKIGPNSVLIFDIELIDVK